VLEIQNGAGIVVLNTTRGTVWGQLARGKLVVTDPLSGDGSVFVSGGKAYPGVADNVTVYIGRDLHFRVTGGKARLWFKAIAGLDLTAVGVGTAQFTGDAFALNAGDYAVDSGKWKPVPVYTTITVPFGVAPAPAP
jgi:hypothetical protein